MYSVTGFPNIWKYHTIQPIDIMYKMYRISNETFWFLCDAWNNCNRVPQTCMPLLIIRLSVGSSHYLEGNSNILCFHVEYIVLFWMCILVNVTWNLTLQSIITINIETYDKKVRVVKTVDQLQRWDVVSTSFSSQSLSSPRNKSREYDGLYFSNWARSFYHLLIVLTFILDFLWSL